MTVAVVTVAAMALVPNGPVAAQETPPAPPLEAGDQATGDEGGDRATPSAEAQAQVTDVVQAAPDRTVDIATTSDTAEVAATAAGPVIEDFAYDPLETEGRAGDICHGGLRRGTALTYNRLTSMFGGSPGTMYSCRERWALNEDADCNGQVINPVTNPNFTTDCWSNHAQGRAFDIMVGGSSSGGYNQTRGNAIIDWLLAPDSYGNQNANARRLGVQQLLWNNKCWNSEGDRGVASAAQMRVCGYGHYDHIHGDMTLAGSEGQTSFWGVAPPTPAPKMNGMTTWDVNTGGYTAQAWTNLRNDRSASGSLPRPADVSVTGDWDRDGRSDDQFLYNTITGQFYVYSWSGLQPTLRNSGRWTPMWDNLVAGDFDSDGRMDEMIIFDVQSGQWQIQEFTGFVGRSRTSGTMAGTWTQVLVGDWDSDGVVDDTFFWNRTTGAWRVDSWYRHAAKYRRSGTFSRQWDQIIPGDWDSQGNFDDMYMWDANTGNFAIYGWGDVSLKRIVPGRFSMTWDQFTAADLDTDGRIDDMVMWDRHSGAIAVYSWRRDVPSATAKRFWSTRWDQFLVGTWG